MDKKTVNYSLIFILFFITYGYFFQGGGWNQNSRICLTRAIIHHQTFIIDNFKEDYKDPYFEFVNTGDWAYFNGHYYTNKSPGLSFIAVMPYAFTEYFLKLLIPSDIGKQVLFSSYVSTLATSGICAAFLCMLLFHVAIYFFRIDIKNSLLLTLFFGFGTLVFSYSTTFYSHLPAAFFSFFSFVLSMHIKHGCSRNKKSLALLSGFSAALAVLIEPSTVLTLGCILGYLFSCKEGRRYIPFFILGGIPLGILQSFYNTMCFGAPLSFGYNYSNEIVMIRVNGKLFGFPNPKRIIHLLFMPYRGLFISSPVFLMVFPGIVLFLKNKKYISEMVLCLTISMIFILLIAGFHAWYGGPAAGPRYLLPAFPFGFMLIMFVPHTFSRALKALGLFSILVNLAITLIGNEIPGNIANPLIDVVLKKIFEGNVSINPVPFSNFENYPKTCEPSKMENWAPNFNSFNLGELFFPHNIASVLPLVLFWATWGYLWWGKQKE